MTLRQSPVIRDFLTASSTTGQIDTKAPNAQDVRPCYEMSTFSSRRWTLVGEGVPSTEDTGQGSLCDTNSDLGQGTLNECFSNATEVAQAMH